jgi:hypothetical protein
LDEEKSSYVRLAQESGFSPAYLLSLFVEAGRKCSKDMLHM